VKGSYHQAGERYVDIQVAPMHSIATRRESDVSDLSRGRIFEPTYLLGWKPEDPTPPELDEEKPLRGVVGYSGCTRFDPIRLAGLPQRRHVLLLNCGLRGPNWSSHGSKLKPNVGLFKMVESPFQHMAEDSRGKPTSRYPELIDEDRDRRFLNLIQRCTRGGADPWEVGRLGQVLANGLRDP